MVESMLSRLLRKELMGLLLSHAVLLNWIPSFLDTNSNFVFWRKEIDSIVLRHGLTMFENRYYSPHRFFFLLQMIYSFFFFQLFQDLSPFCLPLLGCPLFFMSYPWHLEKSSYIPGVTFPEYSYSIIFSFI